MSVFVISVALWALFDSISHPDHIVQGTGGALLHISSRPCCCSSASRRPRLRGETCGHEANPSPCGLSAWLMG